MRHSYSHLRSFPLLPICKLDIPIPMGIPFPSWIPFPRSPLVRGCLCLMCVWQVMSIFRRSTSPRRDDVLREHSSVAAADYSRQILRDSCRQPPRRAQHLLLALLLTEIEWDSTRRVETSVGVIQEALPLQTDRTTRCVSQFCQLLHNSVGTSCTSTHTHMHSMQHAV